MSNPNTANLNEKLTHVADVTDAIGQKRLFSDDSKAKQELEILSQDKQRAEEKKQVIHQIFKWGIRIAASVFALLIIIRSLHLVLPVPWTWMDEKNISSVDHLLQGSFVGGMMTYFRSNIMKYL